MTPATELLTLPPWLDLAGIAVFALSGALLATRLRMTVVTGDLLRAGHRRRRRLGARPA
jgi:hypothetical protein